MMGDSRGRYWHWMVDERILELIHVLCRLFEAIFILQLHVQRALTNVVNNVGHRRYPPVVRAGGSCSPAALICYPTNPSDFNTGSISNIYSQQRFQELS